MREISVHIIKDTVRRLFYDANHILPNSLAEKIKQQEKIESNDIAKDVFRDMIENIRVAKQLDIPLCQDTGMAVVFIDIGQDVHFIDGSLYEAINEGVKEAYVGGLLRLSVVSDPIRRVNTNDNTPAIIHTTVSDGDKVKITAVPKGFGSENKSRLSMLSPSSSEDDIVNFVIDTVKKAGSNSCPPFVLGIGIGSDFEGVALLSKKALSRDISKRNGDNFYAKLEERILNEVNTLNIGPQGFGGDCTVLAVHIETAPTHIAGLPVAVNIGCHAARHATAII
ncbi:MAG TPA: fumarate hydratase [Clostridia bacterium]|nr:fumarate hydratase [Clostridia bacterium]